MLASCANNEGKNPPVTTNPGDPKVEMTVQQLPQVDMEGATINFAIAETDGDGFHLRSMLDGGEAVALDLADVPFHPHVELVSAYKNARREAMLFEYRVGRGKLLVCSFGLDDADPAAAWLKARILSYAMGEDFSPTESLSLGELAALLSVDPIAVSENTNEAKIKNDITA